MSVTTTRIALATGVQIPQIGLGVWQSPKGQPTRNAVTAALELGYRHVEIELTPFLQRRDTRALCKQHGIVVEAYSPLTRGERFDDPVLRDVARAIQRTPAQVLLRWGIQHGHVILPKSVTRSRMAENAALFDFTLDAAQMARLDGLEQGLTTGWDPDGAP